MKDHETQENAAPGGTGEADCCGGPPIQLGVDGNCGFAVIGEDLQSGEAEFVEVEHPFRDKDGNYYPSSRYEIIAAGKAKVKLCDRLGLDPHKVRHYYGPSHPYGR